MIQFPSLPLGPHRAGQVLVKLRADQASLQSDFCLDYRARRLQTLPLGRQRGGAVSEVLHLQLPAEISTAQALQRLQEGALCPAADRRRSRRPWPGVL